MALKIIWTPSPTLKMKMTPVLLLLLCWVLTYSQVAAAASSATLVKCQACHQVAWPQDAWECDVKCNLPLTGGKTYGKLKKIKDLWHI